MRLNEIKDNPGSRQVKRRLGRGIGSGLGKTGGRGGKGQTARTGVRINGFEGGQMPLYRRLPKRGFKKPFQRQFNEIALGALQAAVDGGHLKAGELVTAESLVKAGLLRRVKDGVRVLGDGELKTKLDFEVAHVTKSAGEAIEKLGGSVNILKPVVHLAATGKEPKERPAKGKGKGKKKAETAE